MAGGLRLNPGGYGWGAGGLRHSLGWLLLCAVAVGGALALAALGGHADALRWQPERALAQPWRCISAAWVHLSRQHLVANVGGSLLVAALGVVAACGRRATLAWALAWPLTHLGLLLQPTLTSYGGLSGLMHAGVAVACVQVIRAERGQRRWVGVALLAGLLVKLWLEAAWTGPLRQVPGWDIAIAPAAHASGVAAGLLCAWAVGVGRGGRRRPWRHTHRRERHPAPRPAGGPAATTQVSLARPNSPRPASRLPAAPFSRRFTCSHSAVSAFPTTTTRSSWSCWKKAFRSMKNW